MTANNAILDRGEGAKCVIAGGDDKLRWFMLRHSSSGATCSVSMKIATACHAELYASSVIMELLLGNRLVQIKQNTGSHCEGGSCRARLLLLALQQVEQ